MTELSGKAVPILPVADLDRAVTFYRDVGFTVEAQPGYAFVSSGGIRLHLSESHGYDPFVNAAMAYLYVEDVEAVHRLLVPTTASCLTRQELADRRARGESLARLKPIRDEPWGMREFSFFDPDNNLIRVGQPS